MAERVMKYTKAIANRGNLSHVDHVKASKLPDFPTF
jgi:hypothetical protein